MTKSRIVGSVCVLLIAAACRPSAGAAEISASQAEDGTVTVIVPGGYETNITRREGFVGAFWDLKNDPEKKRDLGPVHHENGILWTKCGFPGGREKGSWYAAPCDKVELIESGPVRVRVRTSGVHCLYGGVSNPEERRWEALPFRQTFTFYPSGHVYIDYELRNEKPVKLHHFMLIIKSNGSWGPAGKGEGANEVHHAGEFGPDRPVTWAKPPTVSSFALQWSNGPTHFQDFLMVMRKGRYPGSYWASGYKDRDIRTSLNIVGLWPEQVVPAGGGHIMLLFRFGRDMNGHEAAGAYAQDYRAPDTLAVTKGAVVKNDPGDHDSDGFNEVGGCYVLRAAPEGVEFVLHGAGTPRMHPAFKVTGWKGGVPDSVTLGGDALVAGADYVASANAGVLLLQILKGVKEDTKIVIASGAAE
jgi:hypothetical protein